VLQGISETPPPLGEPAPAQSIKQLRILQFAPKTAGCTPAQFVVSANLRRRHLTSGQLASIALEWAEELEKAGGLPRVTDENGAKQAGRPKSVLAEAARKLGINEKRAYELRQIRGVDAGLYGEVRAGTRSLHDALCKILSGPERQIQAKAQDVLSSENIGAAKRRKRAGTKPDNAAIEPAKTNPTASNRAMELAAETLVINKLNAQSTLDDLSSLAHRLLGFDQEALLKELAAGKGDGEILQWVLTNAKTPRSPWEIQTWSERN
jgi:hypothetical protein